MQKIVPHLWFDHQAEEAARFYVDLFGNSRIGDIARYGKAGSEMAGREPGSVMTVAFQLEGQDFLALNGGPVFAFNPAISLVVNCGSQAELDRLWDGLISGGGAPSRCGWLTDRFGVSWQILPDRLGEWMGDPERSEAVMAAILKMDRLDMAELEKAYGRN